MNSMADLTLEEFRRHKLGYKPELRNNNNKVLKSRSNSFMYADVDVKSLPTSVDWREKQAVAEVKNQQMVRACTLLQSCGCCFHRLQSDGAHVVDNSLTIHCSCTWDNGIAVAVSRVSMTRERSWLTSSSAWTPLTLALTCWAF